MRVAPRTLGGIFTSLGQRLCLYSIVEGTHQGNDQELGVTLGLGLEYSQVKVRDRRGIVLRATG